MKEGMLTDKGKPNDKTPKDWFLKYKEFSHTGEVLSGEQSSASKASALVSSPNGTKSKTETPEEEEEEEVEQPSEKKKKKKKKKKKEEKSDSE